MARQLHNTRRSFTSASKPSPVVELKTRIALSKLGLVSGSRMLRSPCHPDNACSSVTLALRLHEGLSRPVNPRHLELGEAGAGGQRLAHPQLVPREPVARDAQPQRHQLPRLPPGHRSRRITLHVLGFVLPRVLGGATCSRCVRTLRRQLQGRAQQSPSQMLTPRQSADQGPADAVQQPVLEAGEQARLHIVQLQVQPHVRHILQQALPPAQ